MNKRNMLLLTIAVILGLAGGSYSQEAETRPTKTKESRMAEQEPLRPAIDLTEASNPESAIFALG